MAGAHTDLVAAEDLGDVVRVGAVEREADEAAALLRKRRALNSEAGNRLQRSERVGRDRLFVGADAFDSKLCDEVNGGIASSSSRRPCSRPMPVGP